MKEFDKMFYKICYSSGILTLERLSKKKSLTINEKTVLMNLEKILELLSHSDISEEDSDRLNDEMITMILVYRLSQPSTWLEKVKYYFKPKFKNKKVVQKV